MAFTTNTIQGRVVKNPGTIIDNVYEADGSVVYRSGMLVTRNTNGQLEATARDVAATEGIDGIYVGADQGTTVLAAGTKIPMMQINEDTRMICQLHHSSNGVTATALQTHIGLGKALFISSASLGYIWSVDMETDGGLDDVEITDIWDNSKWFDTGDDAGGVFGLVEIKLFKARIGVVPA
jgi:hypothetical protein